MNRTRHLFVALTAGFWLGVGWIALAAWQGATPAPGVATPPAPVAAPAPAPATPVAAMDRPIAAAELARHATPQDCWMAIGDGVYEVSVYLPRHPSDEALLRPWCGRDATAAYRAKPDGRPHSARADRLLPPMRVGRWDAADRP